MVEGLGDSGKAKGWKPRSKLQKLAARVPHQLSQDIGNARGSGCEPHLCAPSPNPAETPFLAMSNEIASEFLSGKAGSGRSLKSGVQSLKLGWRRMRKLGVINWLRVAMPGSSCTGGGC